MLEINFVNKNKYVFYWKKVFYCIELNGWAHFWLHSEAKAVNKCSSYMWTPSVQSKMIPACTSWSWSRVRVQSCDLQIIKEAAEAFVQWIMVVLSKDQKKKYVQYVMLHSSHPSKYVSKGCVNGNTLKKRLQKLVGRLPRTDKVSLLIEHQ